MYPAMLEGPKSFIQFLVSLFMLEQHAVLGLVPSKFLVRLNCSRGNDGM